MGMTPEGRVKNKIKLYLNSLKQCWWFMPVSAGFGTHGIPDIIVCYRGLFFGIEVKAPGKENNTTPLQRMQLDLIFKAGGYALVTSTEASVKGVIDHIDRQLDTKGIGNG